MFTEGEQPRAGIHTLPELVQALESLGPDIREQIDDLATLLQGLALEPQAYEPYLFRAERRYARTLVHRSPFFELLLLTWPEGARAPVHDHAGQRCLLVPLQGTLEMQGYRVLDADRSRGYAWLEPDGEPTRLGPGELDRRDPAQDLHSVRGVGPGLSVSLHLYTGPIDACGVYDLKRRRVRLRLLRYDQIGARALPVMPSPTELPLLRAPSSPTSPPLRAPRRRATKVREAFARVPGLWRQAVQQVRRVPERLVRAPQLATDARVPEHTAQLSVKTLRHFYDNEVEALRSVSLNVRSGDFVCLVGPSGCGKSTLLYALAGHIRPSGGTVALDGRPVTGPGPDRLLMFQEPGLFPWLSVEGNIVFALGAKGRRKAERRRIARQFIELVQLDGFDKARPHELSGGMRMRASLARALAMQSDVLLMDEPFGSLDAQTREDMHRLLQSIWRETRKTIVFVTHDLREALTLANRLVVMAPRPGRIVRDLEIQLPFPRDPDGADLAALARQVRALFRDNAGRPDGRAAPVRPHEVRHDAASPMDVQRVLSPDAGGGVVGGL